MQKVKLDRCGEKPTIVEVPDDCNYVFDMSSKIELMKMCLLKNWKNIYE